MASFVHRNYDDAPPALRAGNTKTYGVVRAELEVLDGLPPRFRYGLFAEPSTYKAWVRFGGPGPLAPPDLRDNGVLSIGVKVVGVAGPKLLEDEPSTQDFTAISAPTFTTPNVLENVELQRHIGAGTPVFYFLGPRRSHLLDGAMQALYSKTHANPLEARYWSCSSYRLGPTQAMHYSFTPRAAGTSKVPRRPGDNYLRAAMVDLLSRSDVEFDLCVQLQTDPRRMAIEDDGVNWPERLSPFEPVAVLRIPRQVFDSPAQLAFGEGLAYNPWHCVADHRPLGSQNRARRRIYAELSSLRRRMNGVTMTEPTGDEDFEATRPRGEAVEEP